MGAPTVTTIRSGVTFTSAAAASFRRAEARWGRRIDVNSTYRDWNKQWSMYTAWNAYTSGRGPYPGHSRAIHPNLSKHCQGLALDSDDWTRPGFNGLMADHGWIRTAANDPTERHHFEYQSWRDRHINEPAGGNGTPITEDEEDDMAQPFYYVATSNNRTVTVGKDDIWVRSQPGEPLRRLTGGQAHDYFARDGLDFSSPNVVAKSGDWFDAAFAEDAIVHGYNVTTHPYLADALVSVKLDESAVAALEAALRDEFAAIPDAVRQNIKNAL